MNWLSKKVGLCGKVVAIDTNTRFLPSSPHSKTVIVKEDIRHMDVGGDRFHLIHGRYVLLHIPEFESVLKKCFPF